MGSRSLKYQDAQEDEELLSVKNCENYTPLFRIERQELLLLVGSG